MFKKSPAAWLASLTTFVAFTAGAQTASSEDALLATPSSLSYSSAMDGYKAFADEKAIPWKAANDTVKGRGGWRAYAKEASGEPSDTKPPAASDPHAGHVVPTPKEKP
ncbi:hypothetical protein ACSFA3_06385 [Variovorax sp. RHLX14]|uniref:hypothetical protein n=1 Tax=Variovorax sp. RHLX14 TaxID=1259731 RepID=UPI003F4866B4